VQDRRWADVDEYLGQTLIPSDPVLDAVLDANTRAGLPAHDVAPNQGKLLQLLAQVQGARRVLEIGTLGAYSTIWLARALPDDGRLVTLEADLTHAEVALANLARAGLSDRVEVRLGPAAETLAQLVADAVPPFDLVFIDADKPNNPAYLEWSLRLTRPGSLIVADNVVRDGHVIDETNDDPSVRGIREFLAQVAANPHLNATAIQTVGTKGYDGFLLARVTS
jgi:predicted O-methyltransferase YrrM